MKCPDRASMMKLIEKNIREHGFHAYLVGHGSTPRFVYTIGLRDSIGAELAFPGAIDYTAEETGRVVHSIRERLEARIKGEGGESLEGATARSYAVSKLGQFTLRRAHDSWARKLLLGAFDYYRENAVSAYQIVPDAAHHTVDIPDMSRAWNAQSEPIWRYLDEPWPFPFGTDMNVTTNIAALRGERVTDVARWDDGWEMFAGPASAVTFKQMRVVPITCLLVPDPSLAPALDLEIGGSMERDAAGGEWEVFAPMPKPPSAWSKLNNFFRKLKS